MYSRTVVQPPKKNDQRKHRKEPEMKPTNYDPFEDPMNWEVINFIPTEGWMNQCIDGEEWPCPGVVVERYYRPGHVYDGRTRAVAANLGNGELSAATGVHGYWRTTTPMDRADA